MHYIDPHIHMVSRTTDDYKRMALAGCVMVSEPAFWAGFDRSGAEGFRDYFRQLTDYEPSRASAYGIEHHCWLCINAKEAENVALSREVIAMIPEFLDRPGVLGIGEIGLNKNTRNEATVFQEHLDLAARTGELVLVHTPHLADKYQGTRMILDMIREDGRISPERVCIDHVEEHTIRAALEAGHWVGMTLYPITKCTPARAADMIELYGGERMMVELGRRLGAQRSPGRPRAHLRDAPPRPRRGDHPQGRLREPPGVLLPVRPVRIHAARSRGRGGRELNARSPTSRRRRIATPGPAHSPAWTVRRTPRGPCPLRAMQALSSGRFGTGITEGPRSVSCDPIEAPCSCIPRSPNRSRSPAPAERAGGLPTLGGPYVALAVLFAMNLLNYVDRYSFFAAGTHIQKALDIDDDWFGVLGVSFMIVYTIVSPVMGWMGDRYSRKMLLAGGVGLWSLATVGTAFSADFYHMFFWRALLGLGEASYGAIAPALIADLFPIKARGRAMGVYYLALPVGTALGYILGGKIADTLGWQAVFFVVGLPGLLVALAGLFINDPGRGASEARAGPQKAHRPSLKDYLVLLKTPTFLFNTAGMAAVTYATGAYAAWGSTFYQRVHGLSATDAGKWIGLLLVGAGILGILLGMFVPDLLRKRTRRAYLSSPRSACSSPRRSASRASSTPTTDPRSSSCSGRRCCCRWCSGRATR